MATVTMATARETEATTERKRSQLARCRLKSASGRRLNTFLSEVEGKDRKREDNTQLKQKGRKYT